MIYVRESIYFYTDGVIFSALSFPRVAFVD